MTSETEGGMTHSANFIHTFLQIELLIYHSVKTPEKHEMACVSTVTANKQEPIERSKTKQNTTVSD